MPEFRLPDIGEGLTEAEIVQWFVAVGDAVTIDQAIVEVETAKTVVEISSPFAGEVTRLGANAGDTVEVGEILFVVGDEASSSADTPPLTPATPTSSKATEAVPARQSDPSPTKALKAMPIVRKLAKERGIDLTNVDGTGPGGSITRADLDGHTDSSPTALPAGELVALTPTRRAIADHMSAAWREIPHVTVQAEIRAEGLVAARGSGEGRLSVEAVVASRLLPLLKDFPEFNARFTGDGVLHRSEIHLGFAVDTEAGLMVVVVRNADQITIEELNAEFNRLASAAIERTITADEVTGQTFTISNIGALGGGHGTPIIPLGTTAILSIGKANPSPVVVDGTIDVGLVAPIDLSYDHRVIDGGLGQRFLGTAVTALEG
jgi:pyruvate dehydrogenase E2 component (dihydrolipoamide acetyltransferase)